MTVLPLQREQCDRCRTVIVLVANESEDWGAELRDVGWRARPIRGRYHHACNLCAGEFLAEINGKPRRPDARQSE